MINSKRLWLSPGAIFILSFAILCLIDREIYVQAPPETELRTNSYDPKIGAIVVSKSHADTRTAHSFFEDIFPCGTKICATIG